MQTDTDEKNRKDPEKVSLMESPKILTRNFSGCSSLDSSQMATPKTEGIRHKDIQIQLEEPIPEYEGTRSRVLFIAAIDIGATYSGYGFSSIFNPFDIEKNFSTTNDNALTTKILTAVLQRTENNEDLYGYDARKTYEEALPGDREKLLFFCHFHQFYEKKGDMVVKAENGIEKPLKDILTIFIRYLLNLILQRIKEVFNRTQDTTEGVRLEDVNAVVTYPVSWDEDLVSVLRSAAHAAGISERSLYMVSEVQTVLPFLQVMPKHLLPLAKRETGRKVFQDIYNKDFIILDVGGERCEITKLRGREGQERSQNIEMRYFDWEADGPGERFIRFMKSLFGEYIISDLHTNYVEDYSLLLHNFETEKHKISSNTQKIYLPIPTQLEDLVKEHTSQCSVKEHVESKSRQKYSRGVTFENHKLHIDAEVFRVVIFKPALMLLSQHLKEFFEKDKNLSEISFLCMVGGYSNNKLFQNEVKRFCDLNNLAVVVPDEAELVILKGAIYAGHLHWFRCQFEEKLKSLTY
ncbi:uncharacterized protein LOC134281905 [Saccostrea cucullata]|uniref:uncharacterized protein LOC134281905 n=1 Tax=Saccostrea cuccullata TaxID=36930 RepID=UPI002ED59A20